MGISWSIYKLVLADKKSFLFNRGFLLVSLVGLAFVPFLSLPSSVAPVVEPMVPQIENMVTFAVDLNETPKEALTEAVTPIIPEEASTPAFNWMWIFYFVGICLLYTSPSPRDQRGSRMPSSA